MFERPVSLAAIRRWILNVGLWTRCPTTYTHPNTLFVVNEATQKQLLETLRETPCIRDASGKASVVAGIRLSPGGHFAFAALMTFLSVILLRANRDLAALLLVTATWVAVPVLVVTDRLYFDGRTLFRSGLLPLLSARNSRPSAETDHNRDRER